MLSFSRKSPVNYPLSTDRVEETTNHRDKTECSEEISRLFSAAIVNRRFRKQLLNDPLSAVQRGYDGEIFSLSEAELQALEAAVADDASLEFATFAVRFLEAYHSINTEVSYTFTVPT